MGNLQRLKTYPQRYKQVKNEKAGLFLKKANDDLVSHCECTPTWVAAPGQLDCPWCGCGWLIICPKCRKAYTFAVVAPCDLTWEELAHHDLDTRYDEPPEDEDIEIWIDYMRAEMEGLEEGQLCVYIDGNYIPANLENFEFDGIYAHHQFARVPQVEGLTSDEAVGETLASYEYWTERRIDDDEEE